MDLRAIGFSILVFCAGCGGSTETGSSTDAGGDGTADTGSGDTGSGDTASGDTGSGDTGSKSDSASDASFACGTMTCNAGQICTRTYTTGGACFPCGEDGGGCPTGRHCSGSCCVADAPSYAYECKTAPSGCSGTCATCGGAGICGGGCPCEGVTGSTVTCHCLAP